MATMVTIVQHHQHHQHQQRRDLSSSPELTHQRIKGRRRFYKEVTIRETAATDTAGEGDSGSSRRWEVLLDKRVLKTPGRRPLEVGVRGGAIPSKPGEQGAMRGTDCFREMDSFAWK